MTPVHLFDIEGHTLAALPITPGTTGEPVILVHGITGNIAIWQANQLPDFAKQGPCFSLSLPGHYPAVFPPNFQTGQLSAEMMGVVMQEAIHQLAGELPVTLMGHSTGGFAVLNIAARYPEIARRVICVAGFATGRWTGFLGLGQRLVRYGRPGRALLKSVYRTAGMNPNLLKWVLRTYIAGSGRSIGYQEVLNTLDRSINYFQKLDLDSMLAYFDRMPAIDISPDLPNIQAPTLVVTGDRDPTVPPEESRKIARLVPKAELVIIPGARHLSVLEQRPEFRSALSRWLEANP